MEDNIIEIDLREYFNAINSRACIKKNDVYKTIKIKLENYTLIAHGFLNGIQLPAVNREVSTCRSAFSPDWRFNTYEESISDLELKFSIEHIEIVDNNGLQVDYNSIDENSFRMINEILKSIS